MSESRSREYELLTRRVMSRVLDVAPESRLAHDVQVQGRATSHQIDVLWEAPKEFGGPFTVLFECKTHGRRIEQHDLLAFKAVVDDVRAFRGTTYGVFVVASGYQSGAKRVANTYDIVILELREPHPHDLRGRIAEVVLEIRGFMPTIGGWDVQATDGSGRDSGSLEVSTHHPVILPNGQVTTLADIVLEGALDGFAPVKPVEVVREFPEPAILAGTQVRIHRVAAMVGVQEQVTTTRIGGAERLSLTLNATLSGAFAFIMNDGQVLGDREALRSLLMPYGQGRSD